MFLETWERAMLINTNTDIIILDYWVARFRLKLENIDFTKYNDEEKIAEKVNEYINNFITTIIENLKSKKFKKISMFSIDNEFGPFKYEINYLTDIFIDIIDIVDEEYSKHRYIMVTLNEFIDKYEVYISVYPETMYYSEAHYSGYIDYYIQWFLVGSLSNLMSYPSPLSSRQLHHIRPLDILYFIPIHEFHKLLLLISKINYIINKEFISKYKYKTDHEVEILHQSRLLGIGNLDIICQICND